MTQATIAVVAPGDMGSAIGHRTALRTPIARSLRASVPVGAAMGMARRRSFFFDSGGCA